MSDLWWGNRSPQFEWDKQKAKVNYQKHGVTFEEAQTVFDDPLALIFDDEEHSTADEPREIIIGHSSQQRLLLTIFTERIKNIVRLISSRLATKREQKDYEDHVHF